MNWKQRGGTGPGRQAADRPGRNSERPSRAAIGICLGLAVVGGISGCGSKPAPSSQAPLTSNAPLAPLVDVAPAQSERLIDMVDAVGTLEANEKVSIKPEVPGRIIRIAYEEGQTVKKGEILVELDPGKLKQDIEVASAKYFNIRQMVLQQREQLAAARAKIAQARAGVDQARQTILELQARLTRADAVLERARQDESRTRALYEKEFKTLDDLEKAITAVKQSEADQTAVLASLAGIGRDPGKIDQHSVVQQAQAAWTATKAEEQAVLAALGDAADEKSSVDLHPEVRKALAELNLAKEKLKDLTLLSPMDGILSVRRNAVGDYVDKGTLIFELHDLSEVKIAFMVPERFIGRIRPGQAAEARVAPYPKDIFRGVIYYIDPTADERSRSILMKMKIPNPGHRLKPGLFANVQIVVGEYPNATVIPEEAVVPQGGKMYAFVIENEKASMRLIQIGLRQSGKVQVLDGVQTGESVVVAGLQKIRDGTAVRVRGPESEPKESK